ncbi:MAG TPA: FAD-binding protein, partial [bacterium]|nr:FAD-binding protein [bacterium]
MTGKSVLKRLRDIFGKRVQTNYPLARLGLLGQGRAGYFLDAEKFSELAALYAPGLREIPRYILGAGSKIVAGDSGIEGLMIRLRGDFLKIEQEGGLIKCGAGAGTHQLLAYMKTRGLTGLEFLAGIPGSVGGMIRKNAGCFGEEIMKYAERLDIIGSAGKPASRTKFSYGYRKGPLRRSEILLFAYFRLVPAPPRAVEEKIRIYMKKRKEKNLSLPRSVGSVFLNPPGGSAGRLIENAGLKGFSVGKVK